MSVKSSLKALLALRSRVSTQLYFGVGAILTLTVAASLVGWFSFNRVGTEQAKVNDGSVPELVAAFGVAEFAAELSAAGPRLAAASADDLEQVSQGIRSTFTGFSRQLLELERSGIDPVRHRSLSRLSRSLRTNIDAILAHKQELRLLATRQTELRSELEDVRGQIDDLIVPAIDDQFFYTMTGHRGLGGIQAAPSRYRSDTELNRYRHLADLQANTNIATQLLASAFLVSDPASIEPLRESYESVEGRIERSLAALRGSTVRDQLSPVFDRLFGMSGEVNGFDLRAEELDRVAQQDQLLALSGDIAVDLVAEVDGLVVAAETSVQQATESSEAAIATGRTLLLAISAVGVVGAGIIVWRVRRVLVLRLSRVSAWMRRLAKGDLESTESIGGRDEVADMAAAIDVFRLSMLEVQRLNLVEMLADELKDKNAQLEDVLADLRTAQDQIVVREKLAALGELTAGVAHEIKNPLNFVKNFSEVSEELLEELHEALDEVSGHLDDEKRSIVEEISGDLRGNLERIRSHGERANRIVQDMLQMGRDTGERRSEDINRLFEEHAKLSYHAARANDPDFVLDLKFDLDPAAGSLDMVPRDLSRVFVNLVGNAGDATDDKNRRLREAKERGERLDESYMPTVWLSTRRTEDSVLVSVKDNGDGIPDDVADKIFNPFFTTKPTDRGTGLGLAISNDIVRQHGGTIEVVSTPGTSTEMIVELPLEVPDSVGEPEPADV